jgi:hypothetical protein
MPSREDRGSEPGRSEAQRLLDLPVNITEGARIADV